MKGNQKEKARYGRDGLFVWMRDTMVRYVIAALSEPKTISPRYLYVYTSY